MSKRKNVILITIDALKPDYLSCYNPKLKTTPNIDSLAQKGALFTQAIANGPVTGHSFISIMGSIYPLAYGHDLCFPKQATSIAEVLRENGYTTAAFNAGNAWISGYYGYDKGFDAFFDFLDEGSLIGRISNSLVAKLSHHISNHIRRRALLFKSIKKVLFRYVFLTTHFQLFIKNETPYKRADELNQEVISWLRNLNGNFFLWLHYMDTHHPYISSPEFRPKSITKREIRELWEKIRGNPLVSTVSEDKLIKIKALYESEVKYTDYYLKLVFDKLEEMNLYDNTYIILTADHGEEFQEHNGLGHPEKLYDELLHVPLIIAGPQIPQKVIKEQVSLLDIAPTILSLLNIQPIKTFQGESLLPLISGGKHRGDVISECLHRYADKEIISYRTEEWKFIFHQNGHRELYNLEDDPKETKNLAEAEEEKVKEFESKVWAHIAEREKPKELSEKKRIRQKIEELKRSGKI